MKGDVTISLSAVIALGALLCPHASWARAVDTTQNIRNTSTQAAAVNEAARMVPAAVELRKNLDSRDIRPGQTFQARLDNTIQLKNGPELKSGSILIGKVTADKASSGTDRLSLRFTEARLKNGATVPIKATVMEVAAPASDSGVRLANETDMWHGHTVRVDQIGVLHDVDMHSNVASKNSATFVAEDNHAVKLNSLSQMVVAVAALPSVKSASSATAH